MGMKVGYTTVWARPDLALSMRSNTAEAAAQDEHALEDIMAARRRARAARRSRVSRLIAFLRRR